MSFSLVNSWQSGSSSIAFSICKSISSGSTSSISSKVAGMYFFKIVFFHKQTEYQNLKSIPLCFKIAFAVCRDLILVSTVICRLVIGLNHMSWSPLPCRLKVQLFFKSISRTFFSYSAITPSSFHDVLIQKKWKQALKKH